MPCSFSLFSRLKKQALGLLGGALMFGAAGAAVAQPPAAAAKPLPPAGAPAVVQSAPQPVLVNGNGCCLTGQGHGHGHSGGHFLLDSILGPADCPAWTPLCCSNLGEGWTDAWIKPPDGSNGAPRQGWLNTADGFFTREYHLFYFYTDSLRSGGDSHVGLFQLQTPLSRRLWISIDAPIEALTHAGSRNTTRFGDLVLSTKAMLHETQDLSLSAGLSVRTPTGSTATGSDLTTLTPFTAVWTDLGGGFSLRGGLGFEVPVDERARSVLPDATLLVNVAIGQTLTPHEATPFGDLTWYLSANLRRDLGSRNEHTFLSLTPGMRTHLGNNLFLLAALEVDVVGPRPFDHRFLVGFVKGF